MRSGTLRHRITIQQSTPSRNDDGEPIDSWSNLAANEPAEVIETSGGETIRGIQVEATATHMIRIRFRPAIADIAAEQLQAIWIDRSNRVLGVINARDVDGRRRELWLQAKAIK